jgi:DHA2 family multidrug resistance protein
MAGFNLFIDFSDAVTGRLLQGIGMPFLFVTSAYVAMAYVSNQQMNNASAIFNLLRNLGGSFGVAFVTTVLARRGQFHQQRLIAHLTHFNPGFTFRLEGLKAALNARLGDLSDHTQLAMGIIYRSLQREAAAMAFNDAFFLQTLIFLSLIAVLFILRKPPIGKRRPSPGH